MRVFTEWARWRRRRPHPSKYELGQEAQFRSDLAYWNAIRPAKTGALPGWIFLIALCATFWWVFWLAMTGDC